MPIASPGSSSWPGLIPVEVANQLELYGWLQSFAPLAFLPDTWVCHMLLKVHPNYAGDANLHSSADVFRALNASSNAVLMVLLHAESLKLQAFRFSLEHRGPHSGINPELDFSVVAKGD